MMRKPAGMISIMFGMPSPLAREDDAPGRDEGRDENNLDREQLDHGSTNTLELIYHRLRSGDEVAAHSAMALARAIQEMAHQAARGDQRGLKHWYERACKIIAHVDGEDERDADGEQ